MSFIDLRDTTTGGPGMPPPQQPNQDPLAFQPGDIPPENDTPPPDSKGDLVPKEAGGSVVARGESGVGSTGSTGIVSPDDLNEIRGLVRTLLANSDMSRRDHLRRVLRGRNYFDNRFNIVWDDGLRLFLPLSSVNLQSYDLSDEEEDVDVLLSWNIYQATGLYLMSSLAGGRPTVRWYPQNADNELDVQTANASSDVMDLFYRTNGLATQLNRMSFLMYTDGVCFTYVRYVQDGPRFGFRDEPVIENVLQTIRPAGYQCQNPACGFFNEEMAAQQKGFVCGKCGWPLPSSSFRDAVTAPVPQQTGVNKVANGAEIMSVYGVPEIRTPPTANNIAQCSYFCLQTEEDPGFLGALYPALADKIQAGTFMAEETLMEERQTRLSIKAGSYQGAYGSLDGSQEMVTFTRIWVRPYLFYRIKDPEKRQRLLDAFPKGAFFAFAGNQFCESRDECMDDYWVAIHAYPGDGMIRPSIGEILLDPQDALNDLMDSEVTAGRHAVPFTLVNNELMNLGQLRQSKARGGMFYGVELKDGRSIGEQIHDSGTPAMPQSVSSLRQEIFGNISQWLSGALPGMTGQGDPNLPTAKAFAQAREQALGRMGVTWQNILDGWVRIGELDVKHFIENRTDDVLIPDMTPIGFKNRVVKLSSLQGQAVAYAENAETFPLTMSEKKDNILNLAKAAPAFGQALSAPENYEFTKSVNALQGLKLPGEKARAKQLREIQQLIQQRPVPGPPVPAPMPPPPPGMAPGGPPGLGPPPMGPPHPMGPPGPPPGPGGPPPGPQGMPPPGMPPMGPPPMTMVPGPPQSSIPIEPKTDDHLHEFLAGQEWLQSPEADKLKASNPPAWQNVVLHIGAHFDAMHPPAPPGPPPPSHHGPPPPQGPPGPG